MKLRNRVIAAVTAATIAGGGVLATGAAANAAVRPVSAPAAHAPSAKTTTYQVVGVRKGHELAVRASASSTGRTVGHLKAGATTTGTGRSSHGYIEVKASNGRTGWVPAKDLQQVQRKGR
ncbi:SH3 domain-containing protein [Actinoallomurus sp. NPDC052274]|uniref:SH3 domain-containing protein n=1 Tax=Actinoallomurus sp. NPDC052274 TaxID=3155420 RepID=UPI00342BD226